MAFAARSSSLPRNYFLRLCRARCLQQHQFSKLFVVIGMEVENPSKPEELGEEDLVDYEEEEDTTVPSTEKPAENGKETTKKYANNTHLFLT